MLWLYLIGWAPDLLVNLRYRQVQADDLVVYKKLNKESIKK